jgi:2'-5' RNA ligase
MDKYVDDATVRLETSLIMSVPADIRDLVDGLRTAPTLPREASNLPAPHVTLLFVGFPDRALVERLRPALTPETEPRIEVEPDGCGIFRRDDGTCNIHIRVAPRADLLALHKWAVNTCRLLSWTPPAETSNENYRPHITIADGHLDPDPVVAALGKLDIPRKIVLRQLHFRAHPLQP